MKIRACCCWLVTLAIAGCDATRESIPADTVFRNGKVYVGQEPGDYVSAVAVSDSKIVYVGNEPSTHIGPDTEVFDLGGSLTIPGIIDAHSHPGYVALSSEIELLADTSSRGAILDSVRILADENPNKPVLLSGFWPNELYDVNGPRKEDLDSVEAERPVILYDAWAHTVWANSIALKQAGVSRDTKDLVPGFSFFKKDTSGEPTGWITESAASVFVNNFQSVTPAVEDTLLEYLDYYRSIGVTTVLDAGNFGLDREIYAYVSRLDREGRLPIRYHGAYTLFVPDDGADAVQTLKRLGEEFNSDRVRIDTLKIFLDGVLETRTAALTEDYLDTPGNSGESLLDREQLLKLILELDAEGLNLHVHAVGDRAATLVLDAVEDAHQALGRAPAIRITICHLEVVLEKDIPRFKELGVVANFTPHWWSGGDADWVQQGIGEKADRMQRGRSFVESGAFVTFSSDITDKFEWKADRANPFLGMQMGHNRQDIGVPADGTFMPPKDERISRPDLLDGYTSNAAYQLGRENDLGSIAVGLYADLVVLDRNVLEVDRYTIHETAPRAVIMNGKIVSGSLPARR